MSAFTTAITATDTIETAYAKIRQAARAIDFGGYPVTMSALRERVGAWVSDKVIIDACEICGQTIA